MSDKVYDFDEQLAIGEEAEKVLDKYFERWYRVEPVGMAEQRQGIDRVFTKPDGTKVTVEYKSDFQASRTGNAFIETEIASRDGVGIKGGWARTCKADLLVYWVVGQELLVLVPNDLRIRVDQWENLHRSVTVPNPSWVAAGTLVPLAELRLIAIHQASVPLLSLPSPESTTG